MTRRYRLPEAVYQFIAGDKVVGRFLLYSFRREIDRGNIHEARHIAAAVQTGNSQPCDAGEPCILDGDSTLRIPAYPRAATPDVASAETSESPAELRARPGCGAGPVTTLPPLTAEEALRAAGRDDLAAEVASLRERLEIISVLAVGADVVELAETAVKRIGWICPPDLGQPDARWPEIPEELRQLAGDVRSPAVTRSQDEFRAVYDYEWLRREHERDPSSPAEAWMKAPTAERAIALVTEYMLGQPNIIRVERRTITTTETPWAEVERGAR